ncbi:MAG TPA: M12 family metallo-peptidase [Povalibacter sp.]|nr:M12 family metallo-peptidase [Povalibacter sp.]
MIRVSRHRLHFDVIACAALLLPALACADRGMRVERFERWQATLSHSSVGNSASVQFNAYGRQFRLRLEPNPRLAHAAAGSGATAYAGSIEGAPGSWVRLTARDNVLRGMFWDGNELYIVESANVVQSTAAGDAKPASDTVLFRLADTTVDPGVLIDETVLAPEGGKQFYQSLTKELNGAAPVMQAAVATVSLEVSALGDSAFRADFATDQLAREAILTRLNNVDGIFSSQVGVEIHAPTVNVADSLTASLSATTDPSTLLNELSALRSQTPALNTRGLTHLFTGRAFAGNTVGIAFTRSLCSRTFSAAITETHANAALDSLIAAHEIGHVFGAPHDGEGACAGTPQGQFIMTPTLSSNVTSFSQCSLDNMLPQVQSATCLLPLTAPDLALTTNLGSQSTPAGVDSNWQIVVSNTGGRAAAAAQATIQITPTLTISSASTPGGSCSIQTSLVTCDLPTIAAAGTQTLQLAMRSATTGTYTVQAQVIVTDDANRANDSGSGTLTVESAPSTPPPPPPPSRSSGGGGGGSPAMDLLLLLGLLAIGKRRGPFARQ